MIKYQIKLLKNQINISYAIKGILNEKSLINNLCGIYMLNISRLNKQNINCEKDIQCSPINTESQF